MRTFAQDDGHVFCTEDQIGAEVIDIVQTILELYRTFGFEEVAIELSTRPAKSMGTAEMWAKAEAALDAALRENDIEFSVNPGEGAFYGPKIDFHVNDALGREWQLGTVQFDYQMPERFDLAFVGSDSAEHRPVMIHRAMLGSVERFLGILIEHVAGSFPVWLAPVQAVVLPVSEKFQEYGEKVRRHAGRQRGSASSSTVATRSWATGSARPRCRRSPSCWWWGSAKQEAGEVAVRLRTGDDLGAISVGQVAERILELSRSRARELTRDDLA